MALHEALIMAVNEFGKVVLTESRLLNILNDYHGFNEMPAARHILRIMQDEGCVNQLDCDNAHSSLNVSRMVNLLNIKYGFEKSVVEELFMWIIDAQHANISTDYTKEDLDSAYNDGNGGLYSHDGLRLIAFEDSSDVIEYSVRPGTKIICESAFEFCNLQKITLPDSVIIIGFSAFQRCTSLKSIQLLKKTGETVTVKRSRLLQF